MNNKSSSWLLANTNNSNSTLNELVWIWLLKWACDCEAVKSERQHEPSQLKRNLDLNVIELEHRHQHDNEWFALLQWHSQCECDGVSPDYARWIIIMPGYSNSINSLFIVILIVKCKWIETERSSVWSWTNDSVSMNQGDRSTNIGGTYPCNWFVKRYGSKRLGIFRRVWRLLQVQPYFLSCSGGCHVVCGALSQRPIATRDWSTNTTNLVTQSNYLEAMLTGSSCTYRYLGLMWYTMVTTTDAADKCR